MRVLGIDFGRARIGVAVGETSGHVASPRSPIAPTGTLKRDAAMIADLARQEEARTVVLGVPYHEEDMRMERICLMLADHIRALGLNVETVDESLSSVEANQNLAEMGFKAAARRKRIDSEAACGILERYFLQCEPGNL